MAKGFYVTVQRTAPAGVKTGWLLGPYPDEATARGHEMRAFAEACRVDPWCAFDAFGVSSLEREDAEWTDLPPGKLNDRIGLEGEIGL